jgi:hypothetical protein
MVDTWSCCDAIVKEEDVAFLKNAIGSESSDAQVRGVLSTK